MLVLSLMLRYSKNMTYLSEQFSHFAATYSCGAYGAGAYSASGACTSDLANTGYDVLVPLVVGSLMVLSAVTYFGVKLFRKKKA